MLATNALHASGALDAFGESAVLVAALDMRGALGAVLGVLGVYLALGVLFAVPFVWRGVGRIDPLAARGSVGFRLAILPGVVALWPLLLRRWLAGAGAPPDERTPHRTTRRGA